jgi:dipeptidyl aminopeptidase/acylaminoacyl peptidase
MKVAAYGSWKSDISASRIAESSVRLGQVRVDGDAVLWVEGRASEKGRQVLVQWRGGVSEELTSPEFSVRTLVHEYGGQSYAACGDAVVFTNLKDQRLHAVVPGEEPKPLTPISKCRYADQTIDLGRERVLCVREDHSEDEGQAITTLVSVCLRGERPEILLAEGYDFFSNPTLSPDGKHLCWLAWNHPNMPWDGTELYRAALDAEGRVGDVTVVAGGVDESVYQPAFSPTGELFFVSDRTGWWNIYRWGSEGAVNCFPASLEFGSPAWVFGQTNYGFLDEHTLITCYVDSGAWKLAKLDLLSGTLSDISAPFSDFHTLCVGDGFAIFEGGSPTSAPAIVRWDAQSGDFETLRKASSSSLDEAQISVGEAIAYPTTFGDVAHAYFYPPKNSEYQGGEGELPPLLVFTHGGPTSARTNGLAAAVQFFTNRGFAVVDVNYRGSTGFGREYREKLKGRWGIVDVDDAAAAARYLVDRGLVDGDRLAIRGGSAGGFTTLAALAMTDVFKAGASHFGVGDLEALARDTHKFESRYLDGLIGPYPERADLYRERSPITHADSLNCPVIFLQGLEDKVVPPNQAEMMVELLRTKGIPVAYMPFEGEQHGFRMSENIIRALEAELLFYGKVFGFPVADAIEPFEIYNEENLGDVSNEG